MFGQTADWDFQWSQIVARAWADDAFKQRLLADPARILQEHDLAPPAGLRIEVHEDPEWEPPSTDEVLHLVLPARPSEEDLSEDDLCGVGGGPVAYCRCGGCGGCRCGGCGGCWCGRCGCHHPPRPDED